MAEPSEIYAFLVALGQPSRLPVARQALKCHGAFVRIALEPNELQDKLLAQFEQRDLLRAQVLVDRTSTQQPGSRPIIKSAAQRLEPGGGQTSMADEPVNRHRNRYPLAAALHGDLQFVLPLRLRCGEPPYALLVNGTLIGPFTGKRPRPIFLEMTRDATVRQLMGQSTDELQLVPSAMDLALLWSLGFPALPLPEAEEVTLPMLAAMDKICRGLRHRGAQAQERDCKHPAPPDESSVAAAKAAAEERERCEEAIWPAATIQDRPPQGAAGDAGAAGAGPARVGPSARLGGATADKNPASPLQTEPLEYFIITRSLLTASVEDAPRATQLRAHLRRLEAVGAVEDQFYSLMPTHEDLDRLRTACKYGDRSAIKDVVESLLDGSSEPPCPAEPVTAKAGPKNLQEAIEATRVYRGMSWRDEQGEAAAWALVRQFVTESYAPLRAMAGQTSDPLRRQQIEHYCAMTEPAHFTMIVKFEQYHAKLARHGIGADFGGLQSDLEKSVVLLKSTHTALQELQPWRRATKTATRRSPAVQRPRAQPTSKPQQPLKPAAPTGSNLHSPK